VADAAAGVKDRARQVVDERLDELVALSHDIHAHPEVGFEERYASRRLTELLTASGFAVDAPAGGLETAFVGRAGAGRLVVAVCAEYDALPDVGHACGHNVIAASSLGAALAIAAVADEIDAGVLLVGTPAEEGGGGKIALLDHGVFAQADLAMMVHPWPTERVEASCLAVSHFDVTFTGKEAHASAAPFEGVNAADAMTVAQVAIGLLRQQFRPGDQVHGVVRHGGMAANIIPAHVTGRFMCRAPSIEALGALEPRVRRCFEAGALATGATVERQDLSPVYSHMVSDPGLLAAYRANAETLGRRFPDDDAGVPLPTLSTDMANVSLAVPSIHPLMAIDAHGAVNHQPAFAAACVSPSADRAVRDAAIAMAWTAIDAATTGLREELAAGTAP
jgi:amidohydrolase